MDVGYPDMDAHPVRGRRNLLNLAVLLMAPIPSVLASLWLFASFTPAGVPLLIHWSEVSTSNDFASWLIARPILTVNLLFFVNVCIGFWGIALVQRSSWLIDPYWTLIPILIAAFYCAHPLAHPDVTRSWLSWAVLLLWSLRLTHNYLRRERWRLGFREDWRFAKMRQETRHFWWTQFFIVYVAQQIMLVGLTLPYWAIQFRSEPSGAADWGLFGLALLGLGIAHAGDSSLDAFMRENQKRIERGEPKVAVLDAGVWRYSRHPNYFGEQLFWWAVAGWGVVVGEPWVVVGTAINSVVLATVTVMTERRMADAPGRSEAFRAYRDRTSVWIPWPPRRVSPQTADGGSETRRP